MYNGFRISPTYTSVSNWFNPTSNMTTITFAFQTDNNNGTWYLDDVSLKQSSGVELVINGGFESSLISPWTISCTSHCTGISGGGVNTVSSTYPHTGTYHYIDRCNPVPKFNYLSQTISGLVINDQCTLQYYLAFTCITNTSNNFYVYIS